jgi:hypothetical protein
MLIAKASMIFVGKQMAAKFFKFDKEDKGLTASDVLNFFSMVIGIIGSMAVAYWIFNIQDNATKALENKIKYSEIAISLHKSVRFCKANIKYAADSLRKEGFHNYTTVLNQKIFECRSELLPFISGLKVFEGKEYGVVERNFLIELDKKMQKIFDMINRLNEKAGSSSAQELIELNDEVASLIYNEKKDIDLDSLEAVLIE